MKIKIKDGVTVLKEFEGRYLGLADNEEWQFLVNRPQVAHKAFTSESQPITHSHNSIGKRAVFATTTYYNDYHRALFLTPVIKYIIICNDSMMITCQDNKEYIAEETK